MTAFVVLLISVQFVVPFTVRLKRFPWFGRAAHSVVGPVMKQDPVMQPPANRPEPHMIEVAALSDTHSWTANITATGQPASQPAKTIEAPKPTSQQVTNLESEPTQMSHQSSPPIGMVREYWTANITATGQPASQTAKAIEAANPTSQQVTNLESEPTQMSHQSFPPIGISSIDAKQVLDDWAQPHQDDSLQETDDSSTWRTNAMIMRKMSHELASAANFFTDADKLALRAAESPSDVSSADLVKIQKSFLWRRKLEIVALMAKGLPIALLESGSSSIHMSLFAIGMFRREKLDDDSRGSIRKAFEEDGKQGTRPWLANVENQLDVFALEGLVASPSIGELSVASTAALLSKIDKYACEERMIVVMPKRSYLGLFLGMDHYVRLGFKKVTLQDGSSQLIYTGTRSSGEQLATANWVEDRHTMVGLPQVWTNA